LPVENSKLCRLAQFCAFSALFSGLGACNSAENTAENTAESPSDPAAVVANPGATFLPDGAVAEACAEGGALSTALHGAFEGDIDWTAEQMQCQGMPRPNDAGARLRFSGEAGDGARIAFIIAIPSLEEGRPAAELPSNITIIEERSSRFFSTPDLESCWTDMNVQAPVGSNERVFSVAGVLYCIAPLPEVNGDASVSIAELRFSGTLDWAAK